MSNNYNIFCKHGARTSFRSWVLVHGVDSKGTANNRIAEAAVSTWKVSKKASSDVPWTQSAKDLPADKAHRIERFEILVRPDIRRHGLRAGRNPSPVTRARHPSSPSVQPRGTPIGAQSLQVRLLQYAVNPREPLARTDDTKRGIAGHLLVEDGDAGAGEVWVRGLLDVEELHCCVCYAGGQDDPVDVASHMVRLRKHGFGTESAVSGGALQGPFVDISRPSREEGKWGLV